MTATTYAYKVRDRGGRLVEGALDADNEQLLVAKLRSMGYTPIGITAQRQETLSKELKIPGRTGVKLKDVALFSRQFATMINSGLSLLRALNILAEQTENKTLGAVIQQ